MKKVILILLFAAASVISNGIHATPKGYESKTARLAEQLVKNSLTGNYNKTYKALRNIQRYEYRLDKKTLVKFYTDIHEAVARECDAQGIDAEGKAEMSVIVDALFSDKLKEEVQHL